MGDKLRKQITKEVDKECAIECTKLSYGSNIWGVSQELKDLIIDSRLNAQARANAIIITKY